MSSDPHAFLRSRRSIRRFKPMPIPRESLERIIVTAAHAPSAHNKQPCRFVVMATPGARSRLAQAITRRFRRDMTGDGAPESEIEARVERTTHRLTEAPVAIVLCRDALQVNPQPDESRRQVEAMMGRQSAALAGLQLLLAAHAEGLGGVWICWPLFAPEETRQALGLPDTWEPQGMVFIGYPDETPMPKEMAPLEQIVIYA